MLILFKIKTDSPSLMEDELGNLDTPIVGILVGGRKPDVLISLFSEFSLIFNSINKLFISLLKINHKKTINFQNYGLNKLKHKYK